MQRNREKDVECMLDDVDKTFTVDWPRNVLGSQQTMPPVGPPVLPPLDRTARASIPSSLGPTA